MGLSNYLPSSRISQSGVVPDTASRPASPYEGQVIYQQDTNQVLVYDGSAWVMIADTDTPSGIQLIKTQTFSGATNVNVTSCFTSEFSNYRALVRIKGSATSAMYLRWLVGTTVQTNTIYSIEQRVQYASSPAALNIGTRGDQYGLAGAVAATYFSNYAFEFGSPQESSYSNYSMSGHFQRSATDGDGYKIDAGNRVTTSIDGFELTCAGGANIDGTIRVYGYRN